MDQEALIDPLNGQEPGVRPQNKYQLKHVVLFLSLCSAVIAVIVVAVLLAAKGDAPNLNVSSHQVLDHLREFERIAYEHQGSRAVKYGYNASADYVQEVLRTLNICDNGPVEQHFTVPIHEFTSDQAQELRMTAPLSLDLSFGQDFSTLRYGGINSDLVAGVLFEVDGPVESAGCDPAHFSGNPGDSWIAFMPRAVSVANGGCDLFTQAELAQEAGASGVIFWNANNGFPSSRLRRVHWWPEDCPSMPELSDCKNLVQVPTLQVTHSFQQTVQELWSEQETVHMEMKLDVVFTFEDTVNVVCDVRGGDANSVVLVGAHLDSVPEGPGINDDGSGSAYLIALAEQLASEKTWENHENKVRLVWFGAEEIGLLGSRWYARELQESTPDEWDRLELMLNFDMLGSPNYTPQLHRASTWLYDETVIAPSQVVEEIFEEWFSDNGIPSDDYALSPTGGSDYWEFMYRGKPTCGMATGASAVKNMTSRATWGGMTAPYDPCYHIECDTVDNISAEGLQIVMDAASHTLFEVMTRANLHDALWK